MPITITVPQPLDHIGPGLIVHAVSDFIGPIPSSWHFRFTYSTVAEYTPDTIISQTEFNASSLNEAYNTLYGEGQAVLRVGGLAGVAAGTTAYLTVELTNGSTVVEDSGTISKPWDPTSGLGLLEWLTQTPAVSSSFTPTDRTNMNNGFTNVINALTATLTTAAGDVTATLGALFSHPTLDKLTLVELTSGPTGDPVRVDLGFFWYGVIVRITTIPAALAPMTPDGDWYLADLAVLRVRRGVDLEYRRGIHTSSWMAPSPWKYGLEFVDLVELGAVPPDTTVLVDFAQGVEGQVFLMRFP